MNDYQEDDPFLKHETDSLQLPMLVHWQNKIKKKKKCNKGGGWRCGLPRLVSTFLANNKGCHSLDELLRALSFHNPRPLGLCFPDPVCQWIKMWDVQMDWAFQHHFIKCKQTPWAIQKVKKPTQDSSSSSPCSLRSSHSNLREGRQEHNNNTFSTCTGATLSEFPHRSRTYAYKNKIKKHTTTGQS